MASAKGQPVHSLVGLISFQFYYVGQIGGYRLPSGSHNLKQEYVFSSVDAGFVLRLSTLLPLFLLHYCINTIAEVSQPNVMGSGFFHITHGL